jgi:hypothetical protein
VKLFHRRYGWKQSKGVYVPPTVPPAPPPAALDHMRTEELQILEQHYQFMALVPQNPATPNQPTESDVLDAVAGIINSDSFLAAMQAQGVGILRITDLRNPHYTNDRDRYAADPSFDVVFTHTRSRADIVPRVVAYDAEIVRV